MEAKGTMTDDNLTPEREGEVIGYRTPAAEPPDAPRDEPAPWFGYIGMGIAITAMLVGFAGMVLFILYFLGWSQG